MTHGKLELWFALAWIAFVPACASVRVADTPPLADMDEPLDLFEEPKDEAARRALDPGGFTGIVVSDARRSLEAMVGEPDSVLIARIVENSPADIAGLLEGDLLFEARVAGESEPRAIRWPSDWRAVELAAEPGSELEVAIDRAGATQVAKIEVIPRVRPAGREETTRFREEDRVGVVIRTATEVEARAAGLAPGGGAVIVGLSRTSPWRAAGLRFGDLLVEIDDEPVAHPQVVLHAIRREGARATHEIRFVRDGETHTVQAGTTRRRQDLRELSIPFLLEYRKERGASDFSVLFGILRHRATSAGWSLRLLWFIRYEVGDSDRLEEVES